MLLAQKSAATFNTRQIKVVASAAGVDYAPIGPLLSFAQMQACRQPLEFMPEERVACTLANLGVSVWLTVEINDAHFVLLVPSPDNSALTLKLISGYVPTAALNTPWPVMLDEIREECLIQSRQGWLSGRYHNRVLAGVYPTLVYAPTPGYRLSRQDAGGQVSCQGQVLAGAPRAYIHTPTASLQLLYKAQLNLEQPTQLLNLTHVDEVLVAGALQVVLPAEPKLYLARLEGATLDGLYRFAEGTLTPVNTAGVRLSEAFGRVQNGQISARSTAWAEARALF